MTVFEMKELQRVRKQKRLIKRLLCIVGTIGICLLVIGAVKGKDKSITGYEYKSTATLWELLAYCPEDMNRWEFLNLVMEVNGMTDCVVQADRLYQVPVFERR